MRGCHLRLRRQRRRLISSAPLLLHQTLAEQARGVRVLLHPAGMSVHPALKLFGAQRVARHVTAAEGVVPFVLRPGGVAAGG